MVRRVKVGDQAPSSLRPASRWLFSLLEPTDGLEIRWVDTAVKHTAVVQNWTLHHEVDKWRSKLACIDGMRTLSLSGGARLFDRVVICTGVADWR